MLSPYASILMLMALAALTAALLLTLSALLGRNSPNAVKLAPYECGVSHLDALRKPTSVRYYLIAMMFIVFDVEAAFLYPWTTVMKDLTFAGERVAGLTGFLEVVLFLGVLLLGYAYIVKKGALEWE